MNRPGKSVLLLASGAWFGLCGSIAMAALWFRFVLPYYSNNQLAVQFLMIAECVLATVALLVAIPLLLSTGHSPVEARIAVFSVLAPVLSASVLLLLYTEDPTENQAKNESYLLEQARIISGYWAAKGRMPASFDRALEWSRQTFPTHGDADGASVQFQRLDNQTVVLCAPQPRLHIWIEKNKIRVERWRPGEPDPCWLKPPGPDPP